MEQGNMRADVNVSLRNSPSDPFGTRSETKNVNSFEQVQSVGVEHVAHLQIVEAPLALQAVAALTRHFRHLGLHLLDVLLGDVEKLIADGKLNDKLAKQTGVPAAPSPAGPSSVPSLWFQRTLT